jgi:hypothetical protein
MNTLFDLQPTKTAVISSCGKYRYHLHRTIPGFGHRVATFIMLNPSTADHEVDDPTIRKCVGFCQRWGCGELHVVNLFAVRATDPTDLRKASDPAGPENHEWVRRAVRLSTDPHAGGPVVCAWGTHGAYMEQDRTVLGWIEGFCQPIALGLTKDGHPRHPLYAPYSAEVIPFTGGRTKV